MPAHDSRPPLSRDRVLRAALTVADVEGIAALSMRRVARELGFEVMSLYNHVGGKDEILDGILELVIAEIEPPSAAADWRVAMRHSVTSAHEVLLRHPWAAGIWWIRDVGPVRLAHMEALLRCLREAGLPVDVAYHGYHAVLMHILGFTAQQVHLSAGDEPAADQAAAFMKKLPVEQFPYFVEHVQQHLDGGFGGDDFGYVLDMILDGLERARSGGEPGEGRRE